jgi:hypothetical protein
MEQAPQAVVSTDNGLTPFLALFTNMHSSLISLIKYSPHKNTFFALSSSEVLSSLQLHWHQLLHRHNQDVEKETNGLNIPRAVCTKGFPEIWRTLNWPRRIFEYGLG